jgi:hypothetical protein
MKLFPATNIGPREGYSAVWFITTTLALSLVVEYLGVIDFHSANATSGVAHFHLDVVLSVFLTVFITMFCQWFTDHHWTKDPSDILWHSPVLFKGSWVFLLCLMVFCSTFVRVLFGSTDYVALSLNWAFISYWGAFVLERPIGLREREPPKESNIPGAIVREMSMPNSSYSRSPSCVSQNLVSFIKDSGGNKDLIGTGFILKADKTRWIVTAEHVFRNSNCIVRWGGSSKPSNIYTLEEEGLLKPYVNTTHDYVMLEMDGKLHSMFGGGLEHIVPKPKYEEVFVPHAFSDRVILSKGNSYTRPKANGGPLRHTASTFEGCSGAPMLVKLHNAYSVFGIHLGADVRQTENYGCYFGLVSLVNDDLIAAKYQNAFSTNQESAQPNSMRGKKRHFSDDEEESFEELYPDYEAIFGDARYDYYNSGDTDSWLVRPRRRRGTKRISSDLDQEAKLKANAQRVLASHKSQPYVAPKSAPVPKTPPVSKPASLKDRAESVTTISSLTSGPTPNSPTVSTVHQEKQSTGLPHPKGQKKAGGPLRGQKVQQERSNPNPLRSMSQQIGGLSLTQLQEVIKLLPKDHVLKGSLLPSKTRGGTNGS